MGRVVEEGDAVREVVRIELRTAAKSDVSLLLSRTFLIERLAGMRSWAAVAGLAVDGFEALSVARGLEIDSNTR